MSSPQCNLQTLIIPDEDLKVILETGLIIIGGKKCGKSTAAKHIAKAFIQNPNFKNVKHRIIDTVYNWRFQFLNIPFFHLTEETIDLLDELPKVSQHLIVDLGFKNVDIRQVLEGEIIDAEYRILLKKKLEQNGEVRDWVLFTIEEAQGVIGTYALRKNIGKDWLVDISEGRNVGVNFMLIGQRAGDISAQAVERCQAYLFGTLTGDNNKRKVKNIAGDKVMEKATLLKRGEFIFFNEGDWKEVKFPPFESVNKPYPLEVKKKEVYWGKV